VLNLNSKGTIHNSVMLPNSALQNLHIKNYSTTDRFIFDFSEWGSNAHARTHTYKHIHD